jgi:hypothetical protein
MKVILAFFAIMFMIVMPASAQFKVPAGQPFSYAWDYTLAGIANAGILRFECQVDANPILNTGLPPNATTYLFALPLAQLPIGIHTVQCRDVGVMGNGPWKPLQVEVTSIMPPGLLNPRFVPQNTPIALDKVRKQIDALAELSIDRPPTDVELQLLFTSWLSEHPGDLSITRAKVRMHWESKYALLVAGKP